jgi:hypothetical protein
MVTYSATYWVTAETEDEAVELAIAVHERMPDGDWEAQVDYWETKELNKDA